MSTLKGYPTEKQKVFSRAKLYAEITNQKTHKFFIGHLEQETKDAFNSIDFMYSTNAIVWHASTPDKIYCIVKNPHGLDDAYIAPYEVDAYLNCYFNYGNDEENNYNFYVHEAHVSAGWVKQCIINKLFERAMETVPRIMSKKWLDEQVEEMQKDPSILDRFGDLDID